MEFKTDKLNCVLSEMQATKEQLAFKKGVKFN